MGFIPSTVVVEVEKNLPFSLYLSLDLIFFISLIFFCFMIWIFFNFMYWELGVLLKLDRWRIELCCNLIGSVSAVYWPLALFFIYVQRDISDSNQ